MDYCEFLGLVCGRFAKLRRRPDFSLEVFLYCKYKMYKKREEVSPFSSLAMSTLENTIVATRG